MVDELWIFEWKDVHNYFAGHMKKGKDLVRRVRSIANGADFIFLLATRPSNFYSKCLWLTCLLGYSRFPYQEHKINQWFVQEFRSEDGSEQRVQIMNVDREGIRTNIYRRTNNRANNFPHSLSNAQYDVFCHGTKHEHARDIIESGIDLGKATKVEASDFSDGDGYYVCDSFDVAYDWARRNYQRAREWQAVLIYRVDKNRLRQLRGENNEPGLDLRNHTEEWLRVITEYRKAYLRGSGPIDKRLRRRWKQLPFIEGPISSDRKRNPYAIDFNSGTYQLCVRNDICAQLFNNSLHSVVFFQG